jgi:hypothetical protein
MENSVNKKVWLIIAFCIFMSLAVDWLDYVTGEEYDLFILYYIPVGIIAWRVGRTAGFLMAILCAATWFQSDFLTHQRYSLFIGTWDTAMRLISFAALAWTLSQVRTELTAEKKLNTELADAMAQIKQLRGILLPEDPRRPESLGPSGIVYLEALGRAGQPRPVPHLLQEALRRRERDVDHHCDRLLSKVWKKHA